VAQLVTVGGWSFSSVVETCASTVWLAVKLKMRSAANVNQTLRRTEWKRLMKRLPRTLAGYIAEERMNEFAP